MVGKAFKHGFYWPTAASDAAQIVKSCQGCQYFATQIHTPAEELQMIPITWPFTIWVWTFWGPSKKRPGVGPTYLS
jgi:hypothetical protein